MGEGRFPNSKITLITPSSPPRKEDQASGPEAGEMKPHNTAGGFISCHCMTRFRLEGMSKTARITWARPSFARANAFLKSVVSSG